MITMRLIHIIAATVLLAGCAHREVCGSIAEYRTASPGELACQASAGNKVAQLELGIRYENGDRVPRDLAQAERLYARAARSDRNGRYVYSPPVGNEKYGRVIPVGQSTNSPGLPEAKERLLQLQARKKSK